MTINSFKKYVFFIIFNFCFISNIVHAYEIITIRHQDISTYSTILKAFNAQFVNKPNYLIKHFNGEDDITKVKLFIESLKYNKPDLIVGIGSITSKMLLEEIKDIPIIITGLGSPSAIIRNWDTSNSNWTGIELKDSIYHSLNLLNKFLNIRTIGMLIIQNEPSHIGASEEVSMFAKENNIIFRMTSFNNRDKNSNRLSKEEMQKNISLSLDSLLPHIDTLYLNVSKTYIDNIDLIKQKLRQYKVLSIGSSVYFGSGIVIGIESDHELRGVLCADYAVKILELQQPPKNFKLNMIPSFTIDLDLNEAKKVNFLPNIPFLTNKVNLHIQ